MGMIRAQIFEEDFRYGKNDYEEPNPMHPTIDFFQSRANIDIWKKWQKKSIGLFQIFIENYQGTIDITKKTIDFCFYMKVNNLYKN